MKVVARPANAGGVFRLLQRPRIVLGMLGVGTFFMGQFVLFTYVRPFLENVTQVTVSTLSMILLLIGVAGFIGSTLIGRFLRAGLYRTLVCIPVLMAAIGLCLVTFGGSVAAVCLLLGLWGLLATAAPVGWWTWLARSLPKDAEAGGGLMVAVIQLCIALGSVIGGLLFDGSGYRMTFMASVALLLLAAAWAYLTSRTPAPDA